MSTGTSDMQAHAVSVPVTPGDGGIEVPQPAPDVVPTIPPHPQPMSPPEINEPPLPGQHPPVREPLDPSDPIIGSGRLPAAAC